MKVLMTCALALVVGGCGTMRTLAPNTVAGFEAGGVLGALDGATGAIVARCQAADGTIMRVAIDNVALATNTDDLIAQIRARRTAACETVKAVRLIVD